MPKEIKQQEYLKSQDSTETTNSSNSSENFNPKDIEKIENTVFAIANNERGWFLTIGNNIITEPKETRKECIEQLEKDMWNIIMKLIVLITDHIVDRIVDEKLHPQEK